MQLLDRFHRKLDSICDFSENKKLAVAVSGGSDSMALTLLLAQYAKDHNLSLVAVTIDHNLRSDSFSDAVAVGKLLKIHDIEHKIITIENVIDKNIQNNARNARYELLTDYCKNHKIGYLFTGHIADDQIENFFIRLQRGSGVDGLAAMNEVSNIDNIKVIRPLLQTKKAELVEYLTGQNQEWVEDPTNKKDIYLRNKIRMTLKELELDEDRILLAMNNLHRTKEFLEQETEREFKRITNLGEKITVDSTYFLEIHPEIAYRLLNKIFQSLSNRKYKMRLNSIEGFYNMMKTEDNFRTTIGGCIVKKSKKTNMLEFTREK